MSLLKGKVALVTGASKGIGRAIAKKMARHGARIVLIARNRDLLEKLNEELFEFNAECLVFPCDISQLVDCEHVVQETVKRLGKIDILINNAGVGYSGIIVESNPAEVEEMFKVNVLGCYYMTRLVLPHMIQHRCGDIVNIGSIAGIKYSPGFAIYSATKFAVRAFTEALRNEVQDYDIRVALINPGITKTSFYKSFSKHKSPVPIDKGEMLTPKDIANAVHFMLIQPKGVGLNELTIRPIWQER
jgi:NADP-dependent 3-hydroxy acid dehydrogenase YdfG